MRQKLLAGAAVKDQLTTIPLRNEAGTSNVCEDEMASAIWSETAAQGGTGLEVANKIAEYLKRAEGDTRLALAFCVSDHLAASRATRREATERP